MPPPKKRRTGLIVGLICGAVVLLVLAVAGFVLGPLLLGHEYGGSGSRTAPVERPEAAAPVAYTVVERTLTGEGFACYEALAEPLVRSCYRTEPDGTASRVVLETDSAETVVNLSLEARPGSKAEVGGFSERRGTSGAEVVEELLPRLGTQLVGDEAADLPSTELDNDTKRLSWGTVELSLAGDEGGTVTFQRRTGGYAARAPELPVKQETTKRRLAGQGYDCDGSDCAKDEDGGPYVEAEIATTGGFAVEITENADSKAKVSDTLVRSTLSSALGVALSGAELAAAKTWLNENLTPEHGVVQADFGGAHLELVRQGSKGASLELSKIDF